MILLMVSFCFFVQDIWLNYTSKSSSFKQYKQEKNIAIESPTITFCLNPPMKKSVVDQYKLAPTFYANFLVNVSPEAPLTERLNASLFNLGQDFNLEIGVDFNNDPTLLKLGPNYVDRKTGLGTDFHSIVNVERLYTAVFGLCYQVVPQFKMNPTDYLFFTPMLSEDLDPQDKPRSINVFITSGTNAYGLSKNSYVEGDPVIKEISLTQEPTETLISLEPIDTILLTQTSKCSSIRSYYECLGYEFSHSTVPQQNCKNVCIPLRKY